MILHRYSLHLVLSACLALVGCGDDTGVPSDSAMPSDSSVASDSTGRSDSAVRSDGGVRSCKPAPSYAKDVLPTVFKVHCTHCHGADKTGAARKGAPVGNNWDRLASAAANVDRIIARLQAGTMPADAPGSVPPAKLDLIRSWKACGLQP